MSPEGNTNVPSRKVEESPTDRGAANLDAMMGGLKGPASPGLPKSMEGVVADAAASRAHAEEDASQLAGVKERLGMTPAESSESSREVLSGEEFDALVIMAKGGGPEEAAEQRMLDAGVKKPSPGDYEGSVAYRDQVRQETMKLMGQIMEKVRGLPLQEQTLLGGELFDATIGAGGAGWGRAAETLQSVHSAFAGTAVVESFDEKHKEFLARINAR